MSDHSINQEIYDIKRQLKIKESILVEYQSEIELLKNSERIEREKYEAKIAGLEQTIQTIRASHAENQELINAEMVKQQEKITSLEMELKLAKQVASSPLDVSNSCLEDLQFLKDENGALKDAYNELKANMEDIWQQCREWEQTADKYKDEVSQLRELLSIKRDELAEQSEVNEKLTDDLACARNELATLKHQPLDQKSQGNSLFAEVDDRRVHLQQKINTMKNDYIRMQQEMGCQEKVMSELRKKCAELHDKLQKDVEDIEEDRLLVKKSLKDRISTLEQIIKNNEDQAMKHPKPTDNLRLEFQYYESEIESLEEEIRELLNKINRNSLYETGMAMELAQARREIRKWNNRALKLEQENDDLKSTLNSSTFYKPNQSSTTMCENISLSLKNCVKSVGWVEPAEYRIKGEPDLDIKEEPDLDLKEEPDLE